MAEALQANNSEGHPIHITSRTNGRGHPGPTVVHHWLCRGSLEALYESRRDMKAGATPNGAELSQIGRAHV